MKALRIAPFFLALLAVFNTAGADTIYLKNGRQLEGVITQETGQYVELSVDIGTIKFYRSEIERISRSSSAEKENLKQAWEQKRKDREVRSYQQEQERKKTASLEKEISVQRQGDHLIVDTLLNGKNKVKLMLDTGSSLVVLSAALAGQMGVDIKNTPADIKMTIADGREIPAKLIKLNTMKVQDVTAYDVDAALLYQEDAFKDFDGLLGMSFLKSFRFEINLAKNRLILQELN